MATFYDQIGANRRNSVVLALAVVLILGLLGTVIGIAVTGAVEAGLVSAGIAVGVGLVASMITF